MSLFDHNYVILLYLSYAKMEYKQDLESLKSFKAHERMLINQVSISVNSILVNWLFTKSMDLAFCRVTTHVNIRHGGARCLGI
jgi:hypothetical protein